MALLLSPITMVEPAAFPAPDRGKACYYDRWRVAHCIPRNEHIVFMGDSLTRYQWLALATSLHRGGAHHQPCIALAPRR